jgi:[amino group carrier protein]-L-2-aminoadipate 6-kinase
MLLLKVGGGGGINLAGVAEDLAAQATRVIVVHGANAARDELARALGREKRTITSASGYASVYSDESAIDLLMMAYAGVRNKRLVELLQRRGVNALGLCGLDGRVIVGTRNRGFRVREGERITVVRDFSGKPSAVNRALLDALLDRGYTPVLTVPICDEEGFAINAENDDVVAVLHDAFHARVVVELIEAPGLLRDPGDPASVVAQLAAEELPAWEERATGRMKRKLHSLRKLFQVSPPTVILADGRREHPVRDALAGHGTVIASGHARAPA